MTDNTYSIKEASKLLDCSTQNIYQQKDRLLQLGLMEKSSTGSYFINEKGIQHLKEKRIETIKASSSIDKQDLSIGTNVGFPQSNNDLIVDLLKEQIQELKNEKEYWKNEYTKKDIELSKANEHLQEMNITVFQKLLASTEQQNNSINTETTKKGFFKKLFS